MNFTVNKSKHSWKRWTAQSTSCCSDRQWYL